MATNRASLRAALGALLLLSSIWGYNWVVMKRALAYAGAWDFAALRAVLGTLVLFAVLALLRRPLKPQEVKGTCLLGMLQTVGNGGLAVAALIAGGAGRSAVLVYMMPFWTLALGRILLGERISAWQSVAAGAAFAGMLLIVGPWQLDRALLSSLLALASGLCWAFSAIVAKKLRARIQLDLLSLTAWQTLYGAGVLVAVALLAPSRPIDWSPYFIAALAYNVVFAVAVAWLLWLFALHRLPAGLAAMGTLLIPVIGAGAGALELGERHALRELLGMALVCAGLALLAWLARVESRELANYRSGSDT
ncbi:MAG TPA: DMT family transporter [Burkholderiales bacterium]|nr:DMT family transporter [Burkholderiales bacterium]